MDLSLGIVLLVISGLCAILFAIFLILGLIDDSSDNYVLSAVSLVFGTFALILGLVQTIPASKSVDCIEYYIASFHPNTEHFVIGMSQGKDYYMLEADTSNLIEKSIKSSKLVRDEEVTPYIQKVSEFGSSDTTYYIHIPADTVIFIM